MSKNTTLKILSESIKPGEFLSLALPLPELFSCAPMYMPLRIIHGKQAGPTVLIIAAMNGDEFNGMEMINRLLDMPTLKKLQGTLLAVPVLNVYGLVTGSVHLPLGAELDHSFPGSGTGSHASRLSALFRQEVLEKADYVIDLRTGKVNQSTLPLIHVNYDNPKAAELAEQFGAPVSIDTQVSAGSLRSVTKQLKLPHIVYEAGEAMRFDEHGIRVGVRGIVNVLRHLGMLPAAKAPVRKPDQYFQAKGQRWVRASVSGLAHPKVKLGQLVNKGNVLARISDPMVNALPKEVTAPCDGIVITRNNLPLVKEGSPIVQLAVFHADEMEDAAEHLKEWTTQSSEELDQYGR